MPRVLRRGLVDNGYLELSSTSEHSGPIDSLDAITWTRMIRILVAQATVERIILLTASMSGACIATRHPVLWLLMTSRPEFPYPPAP